MMGLFKDPLQAYMHVWSTDVQACDKAKIKAIQRPYSKPDWACWTASAKFAYLHPEEAGTYPFGKSEEPPRPVPALNFNPETNQALSSVA